MCDKLIHDELMYMEESECPFCTELLIKSDISSDSCCEDSQIVEIQGMRVCVSCGLILSSISKSDYIEFYENLFRIQRKSIYIRKYHIENSLNNLLLNYGVELTYNQRDRIYKIFEQIGYILSQINGNRKRIININFIIKKILEMMNSTYEIPVTKSIKTLDFYNKYWAQIMAIIGNKIEAIIVK